MAGPFISLDTTNRALDDVRNELFKLDLLTKRLDKVDVILCPFHPFAVYENYIEESNFIGR